MKAQLINVISFLLLSFLLSGCKSVEIYNGEVPASLLASAKKIEGIYTGQFNGVSGNLVISFEGNRPVVTYKNKNGTDLLNNHCNSEFGLLRDVVVKDEDKNPRIDSAIFDFNPANCSLVVDGRSLRIDLKEKDGHLRLNLSLLQMVQKRYECGVYGPHPGFPGGGPGSNCQPRYDYFYLYGTFTR
ncbi:MAG: hypothetical protein IPM97_12055 [Bdellovibrionaceae bacterium]|nr:hypothetical protein [Pseudobdellovibrionaceae bacterium]